MTYAKLLFAFGLSMILASEGQTNDWLYGFNMDLSKFQQQIQQGVQNLQKNIQSSVAKTLEDVDKVTSQIHEDVAKAAKNGHYDSVVSVGNGGTFISSGGSGTVISNGPGTSKIITSGNLPNGDPYIREIEEKVIGKVLYHTERFYNQKTKKDKRTGYTLDLNDPNAEPVPLNTRY
ncbi:PREDICTED: uncharacterized protein LOC107068952 [Polistes dominula]|uniref:Uncharacterized protein LOC107068952 n=1 Tax=Polistes dominula TaxID=743375 RepID=A0ABM1IM78_POLDO|nr:PREDICTED: uncharacterized protein LOC107068952 [Polistes dominula]